MLVNIIKMINCTAVNYDVFYKQKGDFMKDVIYAGKLSKFAERRSDTLVSIQDVENCFEPYQRSMKLIS